MKLTLTSEKLGSLAMAILAVYGAALLPMDALANGTEPTAISDVLCNVVGWFTGKVGTAIATLAIIVVGIGALMGKVSWGMAIIVGIGVGVIFGAPNLVEALSGEAGSCK